MKKFTFTLAATLVFACVMYFGAAAANNDISVYVEGRRVVFVDQQPVNVGGRILVPARGVFEMLGFEVDWEESTRTAVLTNDTNVLRIQIGQTVFHVNGVPHSYQLDVPAQIINRRTMLPLRFPLESVGYHLQWVGSTRTVRISSTPFTATPTPTPTVAPQWSFDTPQTEACVIPAGRPSIQPGQGLPSATQIQEWYDSFVPTAVEKAVFYEINRVRLEHGVDALPWCDILASAAALRITYMANSGFETRGDFHNLGSFSTSQLQWSLSGNRGDWAGHTAAMRSITLYSSMHNDTPKNYAEFFVSSWMNSQVHRDRLLSRYNYSIGVGSSQQLRYSHLFEGTPTAYWGTLMVYAFFDASGR